MKILPTIDESIEFTATDLFFSITDKKGIIRSGNDTFARLSGYAKDELIGSPHNIIRHPDMPRAAFKLLWDNLKAGKTFTAYVKNRAKCGRYYWVLATVIPIDEGYLSIRMKPAGAHFKVVPSIYEEMVKAEAAGGMADAAKVLVRKVQSLGFESYDAFMAAALREELALSSGQFASDSPAFQGTEESGAKGAVHSVYQLSSRIDTHFAEILRLTTLFDRIQRELSTKTLFITTLARDIGYLATKVDAGLDRASSAAEELQRTARLIHKTSSRILEITRMSEYLMSLSSLQIKMLSRFVKHYDEAETQENIRVLSDTMSVEIRRLIELIGSLPEELVVFEQQLGQFNAPVANLKGLHANRSSTASLEQLFAELGAAIKSVEPELQDFQSLMSSIREALRSAGLAGITVFSLLERQDRIVGDM